MIEAEDLVVDKKYKCKITEGYAVSQNKPEWAGEIATLKFTGLWFRSLKDQYLFFAISDIEIIEEAK